MPRHTAPALPHATHDLPPELLERARDQHPSRLFAWLAGMEHPLIAALRRQVLWARARSSH